MAQSLSKATLVILLVLLVITIMLSATAAASGFFPSADSLFGVTMPDMRLAIGREADEEKTTEDGTIFVFRTFTPLEYQELDRYIASDKMKLKASSAEGDTLHLELEKEDATIKFTYDYPQSVASMFYPSGVRIEQEAHEITETGTILPTLDRAIGTAVPNFRKIFKNRPEPYIATDSECNEIVYNGITEDDYIMINSYLSALQYETKAWHTEGAVLYVTIERNGKELTLQYSLSEQRFTWVCPMLYFEEDASEMSKKSQQPILPELSSVFSAVMPRISSAIHRYPDETETTEDGSLMEVYLCFGEEDYNNFSEYLQKTECTLGEYSIDETGSLVIRINQKNSEFIFTYDPVRMKGIALYPRGTVVEPQIELAAQSEPIKLADTPSEPAIAQLFTGFQVGDTVVMGYYEQDSDLNNYREPIEWTVISVDKKKNQALLLSSYGFDGISFGEPMNSDEFTKEGISWEVSHLRNWLNGEFYDSAFSDNEKERILKTQLKTNDKSGNHKTEDRVFVLSKAEVNQYLKKPTAMICTLTEYSKNTLRVESGAETEDGYCLWWLRDMATVVKYDKKGNLASGNEAGFVAGGNGLKTLNKGSGCPVYADYLCAVRPAMWVQMDEMPKATSKPKSTSAPKEGSSENLPSVKYMSKNDLKDLARFYFGLYVGSASSISMMDYAEEGDKCVVLIVYSGGHTVGILMNRKDGSYLGLQRGF